MTSLVDALVAAALVVVVPLALLVRDRADAIAAGIAATAGGVASASFLLDEGPAAAALVAPWLAVTIIVALRDAREGLRARSALPGAVATAFLAGGAGWLTVSRYGGTPLGFSPAIVELTAVHFHYAGFVAPVVTLRLARWLRANRSDRYPAARACVFTILAATPITAAGITFAEWLGAAGAALFLVALTITSVLTLAVVVPAEGGAARWLLLTSAVSIIVPMVLAVVYAAGQWVSTPSPSMRTMAWTHGLLNALGFGLCGALGWLSVHDGRVSIAGRGGRTLQ